MLAIYRLITATDVTIVSPLLEGGAGKTYKNRKAKTRQGPFSTIRVSRLSLLTL